jgi:hypothetical protein
MALISSLVFRIKYQYKKLKEKLIIPSYEEKRAVILSYKKKHNASVLIETGTFLGDTIEQFKNDFEKIISFELSPELAAKAAKRFENYQHITIIKGDSGKLLTKYLENTDVPCLFWLDGHYSSEFFIGNELIKTAKGDKNTPVVEELKTILSHRIKDHVILIDDARIFTGEHDYPSIPELKKIVSDYCNKFSFVVKKDIIRITPAD